MNEMILYLVGKVEIQNCLGTGRLLLYAVFTTVTDAEKYVENFSNKYYKLKPFLCPLIIKKIIR